MSSDTRFSVEAYRRAGTELGTQGQDLASEAQSFLAAVSDSSVLGRNDTLGSIAVMIYDGVIAHVEQCLGTLVDAYDGFGTTLHDSADAYEAVEADNVTLGSSTAGDL